MMIALSVLEHIYEATERDNNFRQSLLSSGKSSEPLGEFCRICQAHGFVIVPMDILDASEEMYSAMKRSTNGGGENSPELAYEEDYFAMFLKRLEKKKVRACIFDLDGTLTRTQESIARPINMALRHYGLPEQPIEKFNYFAGDGIDNAFRRAFAASGDTEGKYYEEGIVLTRQWMNEDPLYHVEPYEHVVESLHWLKERGIRLAVFSNKPHESAQSVVYTIFGDDVFDHVQGQTDRIPIKPDPAGVYEILELFGVDKEECLYFGDTNTDMMTGKNAGIYTVGVTWGFRPREELEAYQADRIIDSATDFCTVVEERDVDLNRDHTL